jgi:NAD-dependent deacetylase
MGSSIPEPSLRALADRIRRARRLTILTGAGVSAASGVPTFRGAGGLWRQYRPEELATPEAFARDPHLVWEWYAWRREIVARCEPNGAHRVIARWSRRGPSDAGHVVTTVITQNVDDLHVRAGTDHLVRLHGSIWEIKCEGCGAAWRDDSVPLADFPPDCRHCGALARPAVVWFGESLGQDDVDAAVSACSCDVFMTVGTSAVVHPAAGLVHHARASGAFTVEINPEATAASTAVDLSFRGGAELILPEIERLLS